MRTTQFLIASGTFDYFIVLFQIDACSRFFILLYRFSRFMPSRRKNLRFFAGVFLSVHRHSRRVKRLPGFCAGWFRMMFIDSSLNYHIVGRVIPADELRFGRGKVL